MPHLSQNYFHLEDGYSSCLGESEGKDGKGIFPTVAGFSTDLHSLGQFIQDGTRSLLETFLVIDQVETQLTVPSGLDFGDGLEYLEGDSFHSINTKAEDWNH